MPKAVVRAKCARHMERGQSARLPQLNNWDDHSIVATTGPSTEAWCSTTLSLVGRQHVTCLAFECAHQSRLPFRQDPPEGALRKRLSRPFALALP